MATIEDVGGPDQMQQQPQAKPQPQPEVAPAGNAPAVPKISELLNTVGSLSSLSSAGKEYFQKIKDGLNLPEYRKAMPFNFFTLNNPQDSLVIECNKKFIVMIPEEVVTEVSDSFPVAAVFNTALDNFYDRVNNDHTYQPLEMIVVTPDDYCKSDIMVRGLLNVFQVQQDPRFRAFNIESMKQEQFSVSTNSEDVKKFMENIYPHKAIPRNDFGFVLYRTIKNTEVRNMYQGMDVMPSREPFACVTGYTEIIPVPTPNIQGHGISMRFQPLVHISSIQSLIPDLKLTAMLIPLAASVFIRGNLWKTQFESYRKDHPNIGSLFRTMDNQQPDFAENKNRVYGFLDSYFNAPALAIDVVDGLFRIPGLEKITSVAPIDKAELNRMFYGFINEVPVGSEADAVFFREKYTEYIGTVMHKSAVADSRWCDYLHTIIHHVSELNAVSNMLSRYPDAKIRVEQIKKFYGSFKVLFNNNVCEISLRSIIPIQNKVQQHVQVIFGNLAQGYSSIDLSSFIDEGQFFAQQGGMGVGLWGGNHQNVHYSHPMGFYPQGGGPVF